MTTTDRNISDTNISTKTPAAPQPVTLADGLATLRQATAATGELLAAMNDHQDIVPVPGLAWTVSETAAHLVTLLTSSAAYASGARDGAAERAALPPHGGAAERMAFGNARELDGLVERRLPVLRQLLASAVDEYATAITGRRGSGPVQTAFGQEDPAVMTAALVGEQLVHGFDLARAVGQRWSIDPDAARLALTGTAPLLPYLVNAEAIRDIGARIEFRIVGAPRFTLVLDHGRAAVEAADGHCDCWISAQPVPYLLLAYNRIGRWRPLLRREVRSGGRRRGLAMRLPRYLSTS